MIANFKNGKAAGLDKIIPELVLIKALDEKTLDVFVLLLSGHYNLKISTFHLSTSISFLYCLSRSGRNNGNKTQLSLQDVRQFMDCRVFESALGS